MPETRPPSILTMHDLGRLLEQAEFLGKEGEERLLEFVRTDPRLRPVYQKLEALAADAGHTNPNSFIYTLNLHRMVDQLEAADGRLGVRRVLEDTHDDWDLYLDHLILVVEARAARATEPSKLLAIKKKLETAYRKFKQRYGSPDELEMA